MKKIVLCCLCILVSLFTYAQGGKILSSAGKASVRTGEMLIPEMVPSATGGFMGCFFISQMEKYSCPATLSQQSAAAPTLPNVNVDTGALVNKISRVATTQIRPPLVPPHFQGIPAYLKKNLTEEVLQKTEGSTHLLEEPFPGSAAFSFKAGSSEADMLSTQLRQDLQSAFEEMTQELESQLKNPSITPTIAEVRVGRILDIQTRLRTIAALYLEPKDAQIVLAIDTKLSWFRYYYSTLAGNPTAIPGTYLRSNKPVSPQARFQSWNDTFWGSNNKKLLITPKEILPYQHNK